MREAHVPRTASARSFVSLALFATLVPSPAHATPGDSCDPPATRFVGIAGAGGIVARVERVDLDGAETLLIGGQFFSVNDTVTTSVARWDGSRWQPMDAGLQMNASTMVTGFLVADVGDGPQLLAYGKTLVDTNGSSFRGVARWTGTEWAHLPLQLPGSATVTGLAVADLGNGPELFAAGTFSVSLGGQAGKNLARLTPNGWAPVLGDWPSITALASFDDGNGPALYIGSSGGTLQPLGIPVTTLARCDGTTVTPLGTPTLARVDALSVCTVAGSPRLVGGTNQVDPLIASLFTWDGSTLQVTPLPAADIPVISIRQHPSRPDEMLVAARSLLSWDGISTPEVLLDLESATVDVIRDVAAWGDEYLVVGDIKAPARLGMILNMGIFDGAEVRPFIVDGQPLDGATGIKNALLEFDDGSGPRLHVAGQLASVASLPYSPIAAYDLTGTNGSPRWSTLGDEAWVEFVDLVASEPDRRRDPRAQSTLYAASKPTTFAGTTSNGSVWKWDGVSWQHVGPTPYSNSGALTLADLGQGERLFCGGSKVAQFVNGAWTNVPGINDPALEVNDMLTATLNGKINVVVAGDITFAGLNNIAAWDGTAWYDFGGGFNQPVSAVEMHTVNGSEQLFAGGIFTSAGGASIKRIARWTGSVWLEVGGGIENGVVTALTSWTGGSRPFLIVGGSFTSIQQESTYGIAVWDGVSWAIPDLELSRRVPSEASITVRSAAVTDFGAGPEVVIAGGFQIVNGRVSPGLTTFDPELLPGLVTNIEPQTMPAGTTAQFELVLGGSSSGASIQWMRGAVPLVDDPPFVVGATSSSLTLTNLNAADAGSYRAIIENECGRTWAGPVTLTVAELGDVTLDGIVNGTDLAELIALWGTCGAPCPADFNSDGVVDGVDLAILLASWG